ncbi:metallo-hydrolase/oxidoreductase [Pseudoduganella ginsengisoli]|uniref:Uncharacterized protein n=1 Tax=Pseudoduganella ginsengisoli TaxID=1462440 RepID=A0A6L6Q8B0_9BURK|nr:hypothetical protein [Pseudoduganella ginsengisoli]MTW06093.1 hypothetical protein [Pseudoduganella ginsengisoli]
MIFDDEEMDVAERREGYGFIESFTKPEDASSYARINIVLDVVDAPAFDNGIANDRSPDHLSMVRVMTTQNRLEQLFGISSPVNEGEWFKIVLGVYPGMPRAWVLEANNDYGGAVIALNLIKFSRLGGAPLATAAANNSTLIALQTWCTVRARSAQASSVQPGVAEFHVRVADVGHANFSAIHVAPSPTAKIVGYFDVGGPMYFHHRTFPKSFGDPALIPDSGFVALSHWDFDHYSLAVTKMKGLQNLTWYAPDQPVGPNAARLQTLLGTRLNYVRMPTFHIANGLQMWQGSGAPSDRNNSGYVLTVRNHSGETLLTGDVSYQHIPAGATATLTALCIAHHGGSGAGNPPVPLMGSGAAAVSFGLPNLYHHPNWADLDIHAHYGWKVQPTFVAPAVRGDVWLP